MMPSTSGARSASARVLCFLIFTRGRYQGTVFNTIDSNTVAHGKSTYILHVFYILVFVAGKRLMRNCLLFIACRL